MADSKSRGRKDRAPQFDLIRLPAWAVPHPREPDAEDAVLTLPIILFAAVSALTLTALAFAAVTGLIFLLPASVNLLELAAAR